MTFRVKTFAMTKLVLSRESVNENFLVFTICLVPLAFIILGRDVGLILSSFVVRYVSLTQPVSIRNICYHCGSKTLMKHITVQFLFVKIFIYF